MSDAQAEAERIVGAYGNAATIATLGNMSLNSQDRDPCEQERAQKQRDRLVAALAAAIEARDTFTLRRVDLGDHPLMGAMSDLDDALEVLRSEEV